jgi:hypothetical protein
MTENDELFALTGVHGDTAFSAYDLQFSEQDLSHIFYPETMLKLNNWIQAGYVKPGYLKDPRGGRDRRRYSIFGIARIGIIDTLVNGIGISPSQAVEVVDFATPYLNDQFDRHPDGTLKSEAHLYLHSWLDRPSGRMKSRVIYMTDDWTFYEDDPFRNLDAKRCAPPIGASIFLPLSRFFSETFLKCTTYLAARKRGMLDRYGRPVNAE